MRGSLVALGVTVVVAAAAVSLTIDDTIDDTVAGTPGEWADRVRDAVQ